MKRYLNDIWRLTRRDTHPHRCTIDRVRELIYQEGFNVKSAGVERLLVGESLVPTRGSIHPHDLNSNTTNVTSRMHSPLYSIHWD